MGKTSIEWTDHSINPIRARNRATGAVGHFCEKISPGCGHCYASTFNERRFGTGVPYLPSRRDEIEPFLDESKLHDVLRRKKPTRYFWCDMTDLFLDAHPDEWIDRCVATMALTPHHTHQVLTKRPERMARYFDDEDTPVRIALAAAELDGDCFHDYRRQLFDRSYDGEGKIDSVAVELPLPNVWLGVSVEDRKHGLPRVERLRQIPAAVRFLSCEPLLEDVSGVELQRHLERCHAQRDGECTASSCPQIRDREPERSGRHCPLDDWDTVDESEKPPRIDWVIVGGESGHGARPCNIAWIRSLVEQCRASGVACFVKQLGANVEA